MVAKMLTTYLEGDRSDEILDLMGRVLHFNDTQKQRVGLGVPRTSGLFSWFGGSSAGQRNAAHSAGQSFEDLLIEFVSDDSADPQQACRPSQPGALSNSSASQPKAQQNGPKPQTHSRMHQGTQ